MTICIAAICDDGNSIVAITDDKVVYNGHSLSFKHKIEPIKRPIVALFAGDLDLQSAILSRVRELIGGYDRLLPYEWTTRKVAKTFVRAYNDVREQAIVENILDYHMVSLNTWKKRRDTLDVVTIKTVQQEIDEYNLPDVATIIAGIDKARDADAELYLIEGNQLIDRSTMDYVCIGGKSAPDLAMVEFYLTGYTRKRRAIHASQTILHAKKRAEAVDTIVGKGDVYCLVVEEDSAFSKTVVADQKAFKELLNRTVALRNLVTLKANLVSFHDAVKYLQNEREALSDGKEEEKITKQIVKASGKRKSVGAKRLSDESGKS